VRTDGLRIVVQLQEGFSGGILEWQVSVPGDSDNRSDDWNGARIW